MTISYQSTSLVDHAQAYYRQGYQPIPVSHRGKKPLGEGWQLTRSASCEEIADAFADDPLNIGILLGEASGDLVDVDLDCPEAIELAPSFLPDTGAVFGRASKPKSHWLYRCPEAKTTKFAHQGMLLELRSDGAQTVFPPSIHESGEQVAWSRKGEPAAVDPEDLLSCCGKLAAAVLLARNWPQPGARHDFALTLAGAVLRSGRTIDEVDSFIHVVAEAAGDEEVGDRVRVVRDTAAKLDSGGPVTGWPRLSDALSVEITKKLRKWIGVTGGEVPLDRPRIVREPGKLHEAVAAAEAALRDADDLNLFQRGGALVRPYRAQPASPRDYSLGRQGQLCVATVDAPYLIELFTERIEWLKWNARSKAFVPIDCPEKVVQVFLSKVGEWDVPQLNGLLTAPTLRQDGTVLDQAGYDPATGLFYDPQDVEYPPVPDCPSREDALVALERLDVVLQHFPFLEDCDHSAALAAILTALVRPSLRTAPMFVFRAPKMGSGKTLLADVVARIATGRPASSMTQGRSDEEDRKRLLAVLMEAVQVPCIDNVERPLSSDALCSVLTQETWRDRRLGVSETCEVPTAVTLLATGNNLQVAGDLTTRTVPCDLDPGVERPEERTFDVDLHEYIPEHRAELVVAGLTVLRAYVAAGRPSQGLRVFGRFEEWSDWIRSALVWLGREDSLKGRARLEDQDPVREPVRQFFRAFREVLGTSVVTCKELIEAADLDGQGDNPLRDALEALVTSRKGPGDARTLGRCLSRFDRRIEDGLRLGNRGRRSGTTLWAVEQVGSVDVVDVVDPDQPTHGKCHRQGTDNFAQPDESDPRHPRHHHPERGEVLP